MKTPQAGILPCVFVLFFCCLSNSGWASVYRATQDSFINGGLVDSKYGGLGELRVENMGNTSDDRKYSKKAYIEFDISSHGQPVNHAELQLHVLPGEGNANGPLWKFSVYGLAESYESYESDKPYDTWSQSTLDWENAPGNKEDSGGEFDTSRTTLLGAFTIDELGDGETVTLTGDAASPLVQFLQSDAEGKVTFLIGRSTAGSLGQQATHRIASSEYALGQDGPQLTILPEPATISLLCLGAVAILRRSRKSTPVTSRRC